jgi:hypothetical protein
MQLPEFDIFLSYKSDDSEWVERLHHELRQRGVRVPCVSIMREAQPHLNLVVRPRDDSPSHSLPQEQWLTSLLHASAHLRWRSVLTSEGGGDGTE